MSFHTTSRWSQRRLRLAVFAAGFWLAGVTGGVAQLLVVRPSMRALTKSEAHRWCIAHQVVLDERELPRPSFAESQSRDFKIPGDTGRRIALLSGLFRSIPDDQEILLWFTEWGVWPSSERAHMFERFRDSYGEHRWLSEAPAYVFSSAEREDLISFAGFGILFLWDCHVLTASGDTWLFLSHDEIGWICSSRPNTARGCVKTQTLPF